MAILSSFKIPWSSVGIFLYDLKIEIFLASVAIFPYKFLRILFRLAVVKVLPKFANNAVVQLLTANLIS